MFGNPKMRKQMSLSSSSQGDGRKDGGTDAERSRINLEDSVAPPIGTQKAIAVVPESEVVYLSSDDEEVEVLKVLKPPTRNPCASYELLIKNHPMLKGLTLQEIVKKIVLHDQVLPDFDQQVLPEEICSKIRSTGYALQKLAEDGGTIISSLESNLKMYYSSFSLRLEPLLEDPALEDYVQAYRKTIAAAVPKSQAGSSRQPSGSSLPFSGETETEDDLFQANVSAWIVPDTPLFRTDQDLEPDVVQPSSSMPGGSHLETDVEDLPGKNGRKKQNSTPVTDGTTIKAQTRKPFKGRTKKDVGQGPPSLS